MRTIPSVGSVGALIAVGVLLATTLVPCARGQASDESRVEFYLSAGYAKCPETFNPTESFPLTDASGNDTRFGGSIAGSLGIDYWVTPRFALGLLAGYHNLGTLSRVDSMYTTAGGYTAYTFHARLIEFPLSAVFTYRGPAGSAVRPHASVGVGPYTLRSSESADPDVIGAISPRQTFRLGFSAGLGFEVGEGRVGYGLDARYHVVSAEDNSYDYFTLMGTVHFH